MPVPQVYEFGPYRLDVPKRLLLRGTDPVALTPKAFDLLLALVERRDRVVDKAELMQLVWPDSFVEEANLSQTIFVLRKILSDGASGNHFIDTAPRRGYRFVAPVSVGVPVEETPSSARPRLTRWSVATAVFVVVMAAIGIWFVARDQSTSTDDPLAGRTRVVVLPFENLTGDPSDDWLASAFSDSLTAGMQAVEHLIPVSRERIVELYRQRGTRDASAIDGEVLRDLSRVLGVRYYIHGSYQKLGDQIKVVARLVDADTGAILAQETMTNELANLLQLEDDLASRFGAKLEGGGRHSTFPADVTASRETSSLDAYESVIKGRTAYAAGGRLAEAVGHLSHAVRLDPGYARAWALLGMTQARLAAASTFTGGSLSDQRSAALTSALRAVELNPNLHEAHIALALAHREAEHGEPWRVAAEKAIALNPRIADGYALLADWYGLMPGFGCARGHDEARADLYYRTALRLDPRLVIAWSNFTYHLHWSNRLDEALRIGNDGLNIAPSLPIRRARSMALVWTDRLSEAEEDLLSIPEPERSVHDRWLLATIALKRGGNPAAVAKEFAAVLAAMPATVYDFQIARSYFLADQIEEGLVHVDRAVARNPACARFAATSPAFVQYRNAPQFRARLTAWNYPN